MTKKQPEFLGTRQEHQANRSREILDQTPVEIPLGARREPGGKTIAQQIQEQIAIQIAKKQTGADQQTPDQIYAELLDLEDDHESEPISQYEYQDMHDELQPGIDLPIQEEEDDDQEGADTPPESAPSEVEQPSP